jgi:lipoprotein-anchoring transpeptidase ErfK/SrfK
MPNGDASKRYNPAMHRVFLFVVVVLLVFPSSPAKLASAQTPAASPEPDSGAVVCAPGAYLTQPSDCLALGPSVYLTKLARAGLLSGTPTPLPASRPDPELGSLPFRYFHVITEDPIPIVSAPGDATGSQLLYKGFVYVSYKQRLDTGHGIYYLTQNGGWVIGRGERYQEIPSFQGLQFRATPGNSFGWTFEDIPVKAAPGYQAPDTALRLAPFTVVQIYDTQSVDGADWNMIGVDQWVEARKVAQVDIATAPPDGSNDATRWIDVNLAEQTLTVYDNRELVFATVIASGMEPFWTRPGLFQIQEKKETETMRDNDPSDFYYIEDVPWTMYFDGPRALHGAFWRTRFGYPQSHGCVNLSVGDAHWVYDWAHQGDYVWVHDPTGQTPTDPALYHGGAY